MRATGKKRLSRSIGGDVLLFGFLTILGLFMALPFIFSILQSIKPLDELFVFPPKFYVVRPTMDNFYMISQLTENLWIPFSRYVFNSVFVSVASTLGHVAIASMAAFPLAKYRFPGSKILFSMIVLSLMFTSQVTAVPGYIIMSNLNLINSHWALILPSLSMPLGLFLMKQFMEVIPDAIIESARVDGAGTFTTFTRIIMAQVKPAWLTLLILSFQASWNNEGLSYIFDESLKTMPTMLKQMATSGIFRSGSAAAVSVILMLPPLVVFIISQSNVIETMAHSGIKE